MVLASKVRAIDECAQATQIQTLKPTGGTRSQANSNAKLGHPTPRAPVAVAEFKELGVGLPIRMGHEHRRNARQSKGAKSRP